MDFLEIMDFVGFDMDKAHELAQKMIHDEQEQEKKERKVEPVIVVFMF